MDEAQVNQLLDTYHQKVKSYVDGPVPSGSNLPQDPIDPQDIPVMAFGLIMDIKTAVGAWQLKRELDFEGKTYRNYSATMTNVHGDSKLIFFEVQLVYNKPEDTTPISVSLTETKPDDNGALHERHFSAKYYSDTASELQYVEYPYRQKESGKPSINTKAIVTIARDIIQQLPQSS
jgi:hypothetical protein